MPRIAPLLLTLLLAAGQAGAQTVYKCDSGGKISYGDTPCADGASALLPALPPPGPDHSAELARLKARADQLERARHQREARDERAQLRADRAAATHRNKCAQLALQRKWAAEDATTAGRDGGHAADQTARKARRAAEQLALACPD